MTLLYDQLLERQEQNRQSQFYESHPSSTFNSGHTRTSSLSKKGASLPNYGTTQNGKNGINPGSSKPIPINEPRIRKYLVLLQECLAIQFVPSSSPPPHPPQPPLLSTTIPCKNERDNHLNNCDHPLTPNRHHRHTNLNSMNYAWHGTTEEITSRSLSSTMLHFPKSFTLSDSTQIGIQLFNAFQHINIQCYWNTYLHDAIQTMEYKGYILPYTVLISAPTAQIGTIRIAWSRQMLRSPIGFRIEFIGEMEELLADPIQQSQFAPLSDSLCWAILEVTSAGEEAFVESILKALNSTFPTMIPPNRELIYQTLENLIRKRKIYQTSNGYFVVTPDTFRYMISSSPPPLSKDYSVQIPSSSPDSEPPPKTPSSEIDKSLKNSSRESFPRLEEDKRAGTTPQSTLRRHNSLKILRQRDKESGNQSLKFLRGRSLSFKLHKSKSTPIGTSSTGGETTTISPSCHTSKGKENGVGIKSEKVTKSGPSFFKKLFRRSFMVGKKSVVVAEPSITNEILSSTSSTTGTQTADLIESTDKAKNNFSQGSSTRSLPGVPLAEEVSASNWTQQPKPNVDRPPSRTSSITLVDETGNPLYAYPHERKRDEPTPIPSANKDIDPSLFSYPPAESSRCSTLSHGTSLGYGSQGPNSLSVVGGLNSQCQSPTPSMSLSNYKGYGGTGRRTNSGTGTNGHGPPPSPSCHWSRNNPSGGNRNYDYYRKRYPSYHQYPYIARSPTSPASLTNPSKGLTMTTTVTTGTNNVTKENNQLEPEVVRMTPIPQTHYYETIGFGNQLSTGDLKKKSKSTEGDTNKKNENYTSTKRASYPTTSTTGRTSRLSLGGTSKNAGMDSTSSILSSTTTVTQKSTTNMEVEVRLPLMGGKFTPGSSTVTVNGNETKFDVNLNRARKSVPNPCANPHQIHLINESVGNDNGAKVRTTINHGNGNIETHFDTSTTSKGGFNEEANRNLKNPHLRRDSYDHAVKLRDLMDVKRNVEQFV